MYWGNTNYAILVGRACLLDDIVDVPVPEAPPLLMVLLSRAVKPGIKEVIMCAPMLQQQYPPVRLAHPGSLPQHLEGEQREGEGEGEGRHHWTNDRGGGTGMEGPIIFPNKTYTKELTCTGSSCEQRPNESITVSKLAAGNLESGWPDSVTPEWHRERKLPGGKAGPSQQLQALLSPLNHVQGLTQDEEEEEGEEGDEAS